MKIEKINDHQIKCTLTSADLANRQLKLSELAYGSEKAKKLFRDMMQQAAFEFGFEAENIPLMIEAIPIGSDSIILIITKVEDPEEIDTRFSKFAPSVSGDHDYDDFDDYNEEDAPTLTTDPAAEAINFFKKMAETSKKQAQETEKEKPMFPRLISTHNLEDLCAFARNIAPFYEETSSLYKNPADDSYVLLLTQGNAPATQFARVCNIASEYGNMEKADALKQAHIQEHFTKIIPSDAVSSLSQI